MTFLAIFHFDFVSHVNLFDIHLSLCIQRLYQINKSIFKTYILPSPRRNFYATFFFIESRSFKWMRWIQSIERSVFFIYSVNKFEIQLLAWPSLGQPNIIGWAIAFIKTWRSKTEIIFIKITCMPFFIYVIQHIFVCIIWMGRWFFSIFFFFLGQQIHFHKHANRNNNREKKMCAHLTFVIIWWKIHCRRHTLFDTPKNYACIFLHFLVKVMAYKCDRNWPTFRTCMW